MNLKDKKVLVMGIGISGVSTIRALDKLGAEIIISDMKTEYELKEILKEIKNIELESYLGKKEIDLSKIQLIIKSPGIPPSNPILLEAMDKNIKIINDIELGSAVSKSKNIIAITGTNGKTTTTILTGEIFKADKRNSFIGGNIGNSIITDMIDAKEPDIFILETSSFQLENTIDFKPKISLILNISPDHLDWHGEFEKYVDAKKRIFINQDSSDYTVLNYDDKLVRSFQKEVKSNIIWFSVNEKLNRGVYIEDGNIIINIDKKKKILISIDKLLLKGKHNLENILASVAVSVIMGVSIEIIESTLLSFKGVEHRLEFVVEKNGRIFFNDSKATNIDSSKKAIEAIGAPIILIAGGYDKNIEFDDLIDSFNGKVKALILLGATSSKIKEIGLKYGFNETYIVKNMKEAVNLSYNLSEAGDNILLSPACASWGMFKDFKERGEVFKQMVGRLGDE